MGATDGLHYVLDERDDGTLGRRIRRELPHLAREEVRDLARSVAQLIHVFEPQRIVVFGSQARGAPTANSDVDLLVIVGNSDQPPHRRAQTAYAAIGAHAVPLDILVMTSDEFEARLPAIASLPATVEREGRTLYAAAA